MPRIISLEKLTISDINRILSTLRNGEVIAYPTDTIYGLGIDIFNQDAVKKLFEIKERILGNPVSILYPSISRALSEFNNLNPFQKSVVENLLPGKITLLLPVKSATQFPKEFVKDDFVGIRVIDNAPLNNLLIGYESPISSTSVNPSGQQPARNADEIISYFGEKVSIIIDNGPSKFIEPSTILKVCENSCEIARYGTISNAEIEARMKKIKSK
jgi:L-threonylcarbamoyladenylate synthase